MYVERVIEGIQTDRFLYVAHPDFVGYTGMLDIYRKHMLPLAQELKRRDMPIEINMNGFRDGFHYPNPAFIEMGVECGCDFIIGMDAHHPKLLQGWEDYELCKKLVTDRGGNLICAK